MATGLISVRTRYIAPAEDTLPALGVHVTQLVDSYMVWVGVTEETAERVADAPLSGSLCKDWACAMPPAPGSVLGGPATVLCRTTSSDVASSMAQRLARRMNKVVFLSVDVGRWDSVESVLMAVERGVVDTFDLFYRP